MALMSYTVYMHIFPNNKVYIGITCQSLERRWRDGKGYEGQPIFDAILKYGWDNIQHIILEMGLTKDQAECAEKKYIREYNSLIHANGYNIETGGCVVEHLSDETKKKISMAKIGKHTGENHWHFGGHWEEKTKRKISDAHKGMKYGEETLKKKRERFSGKNNPMFGTKMTPEHKEKMICASVKAHSKEIICIETGIVYPSSAEAQRQTGICSRQIIYVCKNDKRYKTAGGFHWRFREERF